MNKKYLRYAGIFSLVWVLSSEAFNAPAVFRFHELRDQLTERNVQLCAKIYEVAIEKFRRGINLYDQIHALRELAENGNEDAAYYLSLLHLQEIAGLTIEDGIDVLNNTLAKAPADQKHLLADFLSQIYRAGYKSIESNSERADMYAAIAERSKPEYMTKRQLCVQINKVSLSYLTYCSHLDYSELYQPSDYIMVDREASGKSESEQPPAKDEKTQTIPSMDAALNANH